MVTKQGCCDGFSGESSAPSCLGMWEDRTPGPSPPVCYYYPPTDTQHSVICPKRASQPLGSVLATVLVAGIRFGV